MKKCIYGLLSGLFVFGCFYFMGAFTNASFDIACWTDVSRGVVGVVGGIISTIIMGAVFYFTDEI